MKRKIKKERARTSEDSLKVIETMMNPVVCKLHLYSINVEKEMHFLDFIILGPSFFRNN